MSKASPRLLGIINILRGQNEKRLKQYPGYMGDGEGRQYLTSKDSFSFDLTYAVERRPVGE